MAARPGLAWLPAGTKSTGRRADEMLPEEGTIHLNLSELEQIARELDVPDTIGRRVLRQLDDNWRARSDPRRWL
jgi:hypothetical protein